MSKKFAVLFALITLLSITGLVQAQAPMNNFCMQPPFVSRVLKPNVMILMDTSGSMTFRADVNNFNSANTYYGYFDSTQWYNYNTAAATPRFEAAGDKAVTSKQLQYWDGNFLNWAATKRMDAVKKVLMGGKTAGRTGPTYDLLGEYQACVGGFPGRCAIPVNASDSDATDDPIPNASNFADQRVSEGSTSTPSIVKLSTSNNTTNQDFGCGFATSVGSATTATISWTLATNNAAREPIATCGQLVLRAPTAATLTLKAYDQADPGSANILAFYNTNGPGVYQMQFSERNSASCASGSGSPTPQLTLSNMSMTVNGSLAGNTAMTFHLTNGASNGQSNLQIIRACGNVSQNVRVLVNTEPTGVVQATDPDIRFGLEFYETVFGTSVAGGRVIQPVMNDLATTGLSCLNSDRSANNNGGFLSCIEQLPPNGGTPLGESIWGGIGYFGKMSTTDASNGPRYATSTYPVNCDKDPYNFTATGTTATTCPNAVMVPCAQSFVIAVTDGEPTGDNTFGSNISGISASYAGAINGNEPCSVSGSPKNSNCAIDNVTLYGRTDIVNNKDRDLRADLTGDQFVTDYLVLAAFGASGGGVLDVAARNGGFDDSNGNHVPDLASEFDKNGDGVADNYFNAQNGAQLEGALTAALNDILKRAGSATANSVVGAGKGQGANILQAFFFPRQTVGTQDLTWVGFLNNLWFQVDPLLGFADIREDTIQDDILHTINDKIATFVFDVTAGEAAVRRFNDTDGNGLADGAALPDIDLLQLKPIWEAGLDLFNRSWDPTATGFRRIFSTVNGTTLVEFKTANRSTFFSGSVNFLQATSNADADNIIDYIRGREIANKRTRQTVISGVTNTWKLGDIIDSTAQIQGQVPLNDYHRPEVYNDNTYRQYINSTAYSNTNYAYVGANDGMLHAIFIGKLNRVNDPVGRPHEVAEMTDPSGLGKGKEQWAYIPKNALPYLRYLMDNNYCHLYYVNNPPILFDASIGDSSLTAAAYPDRPKLDDNGTPGNTTDDILNWRTILIGSMGLGGGCGCSGTNCVTSPYAGNSPPQGLSSYFALDVTDPANPTLLWEFSNPDLGFATAQPAIVKISALTSGQPDKSKNGHWYVVIGSGPTGDVETLSHQFRGRSAQSLRYFVLDLKDGSLLTTIVPQIGGSPITNAFSGALGGVVDSDKDYQDEVVYGGFAKEVSGNTWNRGGVLRISTKENINPAQWAVSVLMYDPSNDIGPVPTKITSLISTIGPNKQLYLYFGTGRYYFKDASANIDDSDTQRRLLGIKEPCYDPTSNKILPNCTTSLTLSDLFNATTNAYALDPTAAAYHGFYINLTVPASGDLDKAERVITDPDVSTLGVVFFTTFAPSADPCTFGGKSFIWALRYDTGGSGAGFLYGFALIQTSTGEIEQKQLNTAFTEKAAANETGSPGRRTAAFLGQPPREGALTVLTPPPFKTILRIKEQ